MDIYNPLILLPVLIISVFAYYRLPEKARSMFLLILSLAFLVVLSPRGCLLLFSLTIFNYGVGLYLEKHPKQIAIRTSAILFNILLLAVPRFIHAGFLLNVSFSLDYLVPLGIAYIILQNMTVGQ